MYGTTVWRLWVLAQQTGTSAIGIALGGMVVLAFAAWLYDSTRHGSASVRRGGAGVAALAAALAVLGGLSGIDAGAPAATTLRDRNWKLMVRRGWRNCVARDSRCSILHRRLVHQLPDQ